MGICCSSSSDVVSDVFQEYVHQRAWESARRVLFSEVIAPDANSAPRGTSLLVQFLEYSDGGQLDMLERLLFPKPPDDSSSSQIQRCNVFNQIHPGLSGTPADPTKEGICLPFYMLCVTTLFPKNSSVAPYLKLLLEAAEMTTDSTSRHHRSANATKYWHRYSSRWNDDKENFLKMSVVAPLMKYRPFDLEALQLVFDLNLIQSEFHLGHVLYDLAALQNDPASVLREILSSGSFPPSLKNENFSSSPNAMGQSLLFTAVANANVEFVKELVANNVGGDVGHCATKAYLLGQTFYSYLTEYDLARNTSEVVPGRVELTVLHVAAYSSVISKSKNLSVFDEILTVLLAMPGSNEIKNSAVSMLGKNDKVVDVTPAMLAVMQGHESRLKILLANGGDQLPPSLVDKFRSFDEWKQDYLKLSD